MVFEPKLVLQSKSEWQSTSLQSEAFVGEGKKPNGQDSIVLLVKKVSA